MIGMIKSTGSLFDYLMSYGVDNSRVFRWVVIIVGTALFIYAGIQFANDVSI